MGERGEGGVNSAYCTEEEEEEMVYEGGNECD